MVEIAFTSAPKGAKVFDVSTGRQLGKTPYTFTVPGSLEPRQFKFVMRGYGDATVEIVPNQAKIDYAQTLHKGKTRPVP